MKKIMIDAGHGGASFGAISKGIKEKDLNLEVANIVKKYLESAGFDVAMTRYQDNDVSLDNRVKQANLWSADIFVSIHHNAYKGNSEGFEIYHHTNSKEGSKLANNISPYFAELNKKRYVGGGMWAGARPNENYYVLKYTICPAVLTEFCFIDNPTDFAKYNPYSEAEAIAKGICDYFGVEFVGATKQVSEKEKKINYLLSQNEPVDHNGLIDRLYQIYENSLKTNRDELETVHKILEK